MTNALGFMKKIHFVGIGGIGMSGIAEILHRMNFSVSGSDISVNSNVLRLKEMGITVYTGHSADNIEDIDVLVYSSAVKMDNPEIVKAHENFIPVIPRGEMLAELMRMQFGVAVAGSHGKTTTTSMISDILSAADYDPTTIVGGRLNSNGNNAKFGKHGIFVAEADESDRSFVMLFPTIAVITNIDTEHMESYTDMEDVQKCFSNFANRVPFYGCIILCLDDEGVSEIIPLIDKRFITYGVKAQADVKAANIIKDGFSVSYDLIVKDNVMGRINVNMPGDHIILNSLAAVAACIEMGVPFSIIADTLKDFQGVQRRLSIRFDNGSTMVIDDYGHHPTEIAATLKAVREALPDYEIWAIFQPHRYSRTKFLMTEFSTCFFDVDRLFVTDIYPASEKPIEGINSEVLVKSIKRHGFKRVSHLKDRANIYKELKGKDLNKVSIITFGAGDISKLSYEIADFMNSKGGSADER